MKKVFSCILLSALLMFFENVYCQTTYDRVYSIIQAKCAAFCHNSGTPEGNLLLSASKQDVIKNLVNVTPDNAYAAQKGFKRVYPGDARKSLLFRKINQGLDVNLTLGPDEGDPMPKDSSVLTNVEKEMIRQWIIFGAKDTVYPMADEQVISNYYNGFSEKRTEPIPVPDPSEGVQIYFGPIFLMPGVEVEYDTKIPVFNTTDIEVYKLRAQVNKESHHMAVFKYHPGGDTMTAPGLNRVNNIGDAAGLFYEADVIGQWPDPLEIETPPGTALIWEKNTVINLDYHLINYSDSIIAAEVYFNFYSRPLQEGTTPILSYPVRFDGHPVYQGGWDVYNLIIPPTGRDTTLTINQFSPDSTFYWNLWSLQAHCHQLGKDYNVYVRNPDGTKGEILYDGTYNQDYTFDTGVFDWEHPPLRYFDPQRSIDMTTGMIHEVTYNNSTGDTVGFGLKTTDEMFITYIFYTKSDHPVGIVPGKVFNDVQVKIYPNPVRQQAFIHIGPDVILHNTEFRLYDLMGREVKSITSLTERKFVMDVSDLTQGTYLYRLTSNGQIQGSGKLVVN